jgi:Mlc titration factor MtfA (ptsG expression regulator)
MIGDTTRSVRERQQLIQTVASAVGAYAAANPASRFAGVPQPGSGIY